MKKNRDSFFSEYSMQNGMINTPPFMGNNPSYNMYSDIDARLSKIERSIDRLEARVNRLEGDNHSNMGSEYNSNSMYML